MCNSQISCFSPCKLLRGKEEAVSLQSHLHLSLSSCFPQGKSARCVLHRQSLACRIPGCTFPAKSHQCRSCCLEGEVITPSPPHMALSCAFVVGPSLSHVRPFATPWTVAVQASLSFINFWSLLKLTSFESMMLSNHLTLCRLLLLMPPVFASIRVFSNESALHIRWPKYWNFSFSLSPSNGYSWLISFRNDWFDLLTVQETLKSLLQL